MRADHRCFLLHRRIFSPGIFSVKFHAPALASAVAPGQFVMLSVPGRVRPYLRRAYSVADAQPDTGQVEFLVRTIGPGTQALQELATETAVDLLGPFGHPFSTDSLPRRARVAIVAGGIGAAPFPLLLRRLAAHGAVSDLYFGARHAADLSLAPRFAGLVSGETTLVTDDGSLGEKGFVTDVFARRLSAGISYDRVFACGPTPMFVALAPIVAQHAVAAEFSTEAAMGCGFGACLGCVLPGTEKPFVITCQEGPVLPPEKIAWS